MVFDSMPGDHFTAGFIKVIHIILLITRLHLSGARSRQTFQAIKLKMLHWKGRASALQEFHSSIIDRAAMCPKVIVGVE